MGLYLINSEIQQAVVLLNLLKDLEYVLYIIVNTGYNDGVQYYFEYKIEYPEMDDLMVTIHCKGIYYGVMSENGNWIAITAERFFEKLNAMISEARYDISFKKGEDGIYIPSKK